MLSFSKRVYSRQLQDFISNNAFCTFLTSTRQGLFLSHINLIQVESGQYFGHLSAANPQAKTLSGDTTVLAIFKRDALNRANEIQAVHFHGSISLIEDKAELASMLSQLVTKYESSKSTPWKVDWSKREYTSQMNGVVGFYVIPTLIEEAIIASGVESNLDPAQQINVSTPVKLDQLRTRGVTPIYTPILFGNSLLDTIQALMNKPVLYILITYSDTGPLNAYHVTLTANPDGKDIKLTGQIIIDESKSPLESGDALNSMLIFNGPHAYISPSWYKTPYSVPTWNYITLHMHGTLTTTKRQHNMRQQIEFVVNKIDSKHKLNQNRTREDRIGVIDGLSESSCPIDRAVAQSMSKF